MCPATRWRPLESHEKCLPDEIICHSNGDRLQEILHTWVFAVDRRQYTLQEVVSERSEVSHRRRRRCSTVNIASFLLEQRSKSGERLDGSETTT